MKSISLIVCLLFTYCASHNNSSKQIMKNESLANKVHSSNDSLKIISSDHFYTAKLIDRNSSIKVSLNELKIRNDKIYSNKDNLELFNNPEYQKVTKFSDDSNIILAYLISDGNWIQFSDDGRIEFEFSKSNDFMLELDNCQLESGVSFDEFKNYFPEFLEFRTKEEIDNNSLIIGIDPGDQMLGIFWNPETELINRIVLYNNT